MTFQLVMDNLVKIRAVAADGSQSFGSGVVVATNRLATACHVTRDAKTIAWRDGRFWSIAPSSDRFQRLCCTAAVGRK